MNDRCVTLATTTLAAMLAAGAVQTAQADPVDLYVDSAPNVFGSPDYAPWWQAAKQSVADGTFTNLANGSFPGTNTVAPDDFIVYSYGDLGNRVHWVYWLEGESVSNLENRFQVKFVYDWDGEDWTYDWGTGQQVLDAPETGWVQPGSWENYEGGVIGTFGFAFWASDPNNPNQDWEEYDELVDLILANQTNLRGLARYRTDVNSDWQVFNLDLQVIPAPAAAPLLAAGIAAFAVRRRRRIER